MGLEARALAIWEEKSCVIYLFNLLATVMYPKTTYNVTNVMIMW